MPWVGSAPAVPHDGVVDQPHYLQAVARNCDGAIEYRWDYDGNGVYDMAWAPAPNRWNLGTQFTYAGLDQTRLFIARVQGRCGGAEGPTATAEFPIRVHVAPTRNTRVNRAISNGLWFGHITVVRDVANQQARFGGQSHNWTDSAMLAQAMMNRGHRAGIDGQIDPYIETVRWLLDYVASHMLTVDISALQAGENADVNGNGIGLKCEGEENYVGGACLEAIASWGDPEYMMPANLPANVAGRRLGDVVQDAAEYFMWSQSEIAFEGGFAGGWDYSVNGGQIDSSQVGWAAVGLFAARDSGGAEVPAWVTDRLRLGVAFMDASRGGNPALAGGYGYRVFSECGANHARSGAMLNALGFATSGDRADPQVQATVNYIGSIFANEAAPDCWGGRNLGNFYAMYQISKGLRSYRPQFETVGANIDWYAAYADWLIANQQPNGRWNNDNTWMAAREITHALGLLVLIPTVFEAPPTAVAAAAPTRVGPGDTVTFYHGGSYVLDPTSRIVTYRWDFVRYPDGFDANGDGDFDDEGDHPPEDLDGDGQVTGDEIVWEVETNDPALRPTWAFEAEIDFGQQVTFDVVLQVEDDQGRVDEDRESVIIEVSYVNHPPVALGHPGGNDRIYSGSAGTLVALDASASFDPDSDDDPADGFPRDALTFIGWDLDGDGVFESEMPMVDFPIPADAEVGSTRVVQVRVCDDGTWLGVPDAECEGGDCSLCRTADARIEVVPVPPPVPDIGGDNAVVVEEGKTLLIDGSTSSHPAGFDFELVWFCEGIPLRASADGMTATVDAAAIDGRVGGPTYNCSLTALDELGQTGLLEFTVTVANAPPEVTLARVVGEPVEGGTVDIRIQADDVPGDAPFLLYSVDCDGDGIFEVRNSRSNIITCALDDGRYDPIVMVDDEDGGVTVVEVDGFDVDNIPPSFGDFACPETREGELVVLQIGVYDPADPVSCSLAAPRPNQAQIAAGDCTLVWTPTYAQALSGQVDFTVVANDGDGGIGRLDFSCFPTVRDDDADGLPDSWEDRYGTDPTVDDCDVDYDGDGMSNCDEFEGGTLPRVYEGPGMPGLISPIGGVIVDTATPNLVSRNTADTLGRSLDYVYWLYATLDGDAIHMSNPVDETPGQTTYRAPAGLLRENQTYYWTVAATNGLVTGPAPARARFVVDAIEEPAPAPRIITPVNGGMSPDGIPPVGLTPVVDPDPGDVLTYECEAATDADFEDVQGTADGENVGGQVAVQFAGLAGDTTYWIRCRALDQDGNPGLWSDPIRYAINNPPVAAVAPPVLELPEGGDGVVTSASTDADEGELTYRWSCPAALGVIPDGPSLEIDAAAIDAPAAGSTYQCRLTVTDAHGASDSTTFVVRVHNVAPTANVVCPAVTEGTPVSIVIEPTDAGGDQVACGWAMPAPAASALAGCTVEWTPTYAQALAGEVHFSVRLTDDDGARTDVPFTCNPEILDGDGNGLPDTWEEDNDIDDPDGDADGDGVSNRDEWEDGTDPNGYDGPSELSLVSPIGDVIVDTATPTLVLNNGTDGLDRPLSYRYAIFEGAEGGEPIATSDLVPEGDETTGWIPADALAENGRFWWTAQGDNGVLPGPWAEREAFRVDATPEAPDAPTILRPMSGDAVDDTPVRVTLQNSSDPDPDPELTYDCQIATDAEFMDVVGDGEAVEGADGTTRVDIEALVDENQGYWIRCRAVDETGLESLWSEPVKVGIDRTNEPPSAPELIAPVADDVLDPGGITFEVGNSVDPEGDSLTYFIQVSTTPDFLDLLFSASKEAGADNLVAFGPEELGPGVWYYRAWAHDGLLAGPMSTARFLVSDPGTGEDTINGGGCACDVSDTDPVSPLAALLGVLLLGLRRRRAQ